MMVSDLTEEVVLFKREHTITTQARPQQKKEEKNTSRTSLQVGVGASRW